MNRAVTIDTGRIVRSLMAGTAMGAIASVRDRAPLLLADHEGALSLTVDDCLRRTAMSLAYYLDGANFGPASPQLLLRDDVGADPALVAAGVEQAVGLQVLHMFYAAAGEDGAADALQRAAAGARRALVRLLQGSQPAPGRLRGGL